jgi:hypothetical protein
MSDEDESAPAQLRESVGSYGGVFLLLLDITGSMPRYCQQAIAFLKYQSGASQPAGNNLKASIRHSINQTFALTVGLYGGAGLLAAQTDFIHRSYQRWRRCWGLHGRAPSQTMAYPAQHSH